MENEWKLYSRRGQAEMRPYIPGEMLPAEVSISKADRIDGCPKEGDMIARNPDNPGDMWLVNKDFFEKNYCLKKTDK